jgi:hypothetical protein
MSTYRAYYYFSIFCYLITRKSEALIRYADWPARKGGGLRQDGRTGETHSHCRWTRHNNTFNWHDCFH